MEKKSVFREPVTLLILCAAVGLLAAVGVFGSIVGFPWIFGLVCLGFGLLSLRQQPRVSLLPRLVLILLGPTLATAGFLVYLERGELSRVALQAEVAAAVTGTAAPRLTGLQALNVESAILEQAASYSSPATIVTFWARWCSPCWEELPELDELYRLHAEDGLEVIALTRYDQPDDEPARRSQFAKDREFVRDRGLSLPFAVSTDAGVYRGFDVRSVPSTALVDGQGNIVAYGIGLEGGREVMRRALALIGEG